MLLPCGFPDSFGILQDPSGSFEGFFFVAVGLAQLQLELAIFRKKKKKVNTNELTVIRIIPEYGTDWSVDTGQRS